MRRFSGGNIGGKNRPGSGVYSMGQQFNEKVDGQWPASDSPVEQTVDYEYVSLDPWYRNPSWMTLPNVVSTDEKVVCLVGVYPNKEYVSFSAIGNYTVDWGDGTVENFSSNTVASHAYDYTDSHLSNTNAPATLTVSTSTVNRSSHGYSNGNKVQLFNVASTTGIIEGNQYYVVNKTTHTFQIALTENGTPITFGGSDGTANLLRYKQAILIVTPQAGQQITRFNFQEYNSYLGNRNYSSPILEVVLSLPNLDSVGLNVIGGDNVDYPSAKIRLDAIEQFKIKNLGNQTSMAGMFSLMYNLQSYEISNANSVTNYANLFYGCQNLKYAPAFTFNAGADASYLFKQCYALSKIDENFDFSPITTASGMFYYTTSLFEYPAVMDFSNCEWFDSMFWNCYFTKIPKIKFGVPWYGYQMFAWTQLKDVTSVDIDLSLCTNADWLFYGTQSLETVEIDNMSLCTSVESMFNRSYVRKVNLSNFDSITSMESMFEGAEQLEDVILSSKTCPVQYIDYMFASCYGLRNVTFMEGTPLPNLTDVGAMFYRCYSLIGVNKFDTSNATSVNQMFSQCYSLRSVPLFDLSNCTNISAMFSECYALESVPLFNTATATNMSSMFNECYTLKEVPHFNTSNVTTMGGMFSGCTQLTTIPAFDTSKVTDVGYMFYQSGIETIPSLNLTNVTSSTQQMFSFCSRLRSIPYLDMPKVSDISFMFGYCVALESAPSMNLKTGNINAGQAFWKARNLKYIPDFDKSRYTFTNIYQMFTDCYSLTRIPAMNVASGSGYSYQSIISNPYNLSNVSMVGLAETIDLTGAKLQRSDIEYFFNNLANVYSKTLTIAGNPGVADFLLPTTVSGSNGSNVLTTNNTTNIYTGALVTGNNLVAVVAATYQPYSWYSTFTKTNHGLSTNDFITFSPPGNDIGGYGTVSSGYVYKLSDNTFQITKNQNGNGAYTFYYGSGNITYSKQCAVANVVTNTSVTLTQNIIADITNGKIYAPDRFLANATSRGWTIAY